MARMSKKEKEKYEERAVIIDGDMLSPEDSRVVKAKAELKTVEQMYVNATVDNFLDKIEEKKQEIESKIEQYIQDNVGYDEDGNKKLNIANPDMTEYIVNRLFFNSLCPLSSKEPKYNAEKLGIVFDMYEELVMEVNAKICKMTPSKSHFCRFAGITVATYNSYKTSEDVDMQIVINKIDDMLADVHMTLAEERKTDTAAMKYRMNVEMDVRENYSPQVFIKADAKDLSSYKDRIASLGSMVIEGEWEEIDENGE